MRKGWFLILIVILSIVFSSSVYSKFPEDEKVRFEKCPIGTYVFPIGEYLINYTCYEINLKSNSSNIVINAKCDRFDIYPGFWENSRNELHLSKTKIKNDEYLLENFRFNKNYFEIVGCFIDGTKLQDVGLFVNLKSVKPSADVRLTTLENKSKQEGVINKNQTERIEKIEKEQESQHCKDKIGFLPELFGILMLIINLLFKKNVNDLLNKKFWILLYKSKKFWIFSVIIVFIYSIVKFNSGVRILICNFL